MGEVKTIGILTGGGDCPGLNAVIRAVVRKSIKHDIAVLGIMNGWRGLIEDTVVPLTDKHVSGILPKGGTILCTSRTNPFKESTYIETLKKTMQRHHMDALVAIGGEDTLGAAQKLHELGIPVVGVPKTIDNDLCGTDYTFGFDTAVSIVTDAIDRLHTTAESHHRIMVLEVMGRHTGWIATISGIAGGADEILIPEFPFDIEKVCRNLDNRRKSGKSFSIVIVAEGATPKNIDDFVTVCGEKDEFGHVRLGGIGALIAKEIEKRLGLETRVTVLGHVQRGGSPTAYDRVLATRFGIAAVEALLREDFGKMVALRGNAIEIVSLQEAVAKLKTVDLGLFSIAQTFFGDANGKTACEETAGKPTR